MVSNTKERATNKVNPYFLKIPWNLDQIISMSLAMSKYGNI